MDTLIHIGYSKTASTWFQTQVFPNIKNVDYIDKPIIREHILEPNSFNFNPDKIQNYFKSNYKKRLLLSHENIVGTLGSAGFNGIATKDFGARLKSVFPKADVIIFIRNQAEIIASSYIQSIKQGSTYNVDTFLFHKNKNLHDNMMMFSFVYFEYDKLIKYYSSLFGQDKVHVFLYEEFEEDKIKFVKNFSSVFNLDINLDNINTDKSNSKLRSGLIPMVKFANIFTKKNTVFKYYLLNIPYWYQLSGKIFDSLGRYKIFGAPPSAVCVLGKKNYDLINNYYRISNNILANEFGLKDIDKYNYPV